MENYHTKESKIFSFWKGFSSAFSFGFGERRMDAFQREMDSVSVEEALRRDWLQVGADLQKAFEKLTR